MSIRKINSYLKENNIQIIDYWIDKTLRIHYLRTFHVLTCSFFFLNIYFYDILLDKNDIYYQKVFYLTKIEENREDFSEEMILFLEKIENCFPQYSSNIIFQYFDYIIENRNKIFKIIPYQSSDSFQYLSVYFLTDLYMIINNKSNIEYSIWNFSEDFFKYIQNIHLTFNDSIENHYTSIVKTVESLYGNIISFHSSDLKIKELWVNIHRFHIELTTNVKKLEDYSDVFSVHDTNLKIQKKNELKEKIKKVLDLKSKIKLEVLLLYEKLFHLEIIFLYNVLELKKNLISIDSLLIQMKKEL